MRRPPIYLAVIIPMLLLGLVPVVALERLYARTAGVDISAVPSPNGVLIAVPTLVLWVPLALIFSNLVLYAVPRLRSTADAFAAANPAVVSSFSASQRRLAKLTALLAAICIPLIAWGFYK